MTFDYLVSSFICTSCFLQLVLIKHFRLLFLLCDLPFIFSLLPPPFSFVIIIAVTWSTLSFQCLLRVIRLDYNACHRTHIFDFQTPETTHFIPGIPNNRASRSLLNTWDSAGVQTWSSPYACKADIFPVSHFQAQFL